METEVEIEGVKHKVEINPEQLGFVSNEKMDQIRTESYQRGISKVNTELASATERIAELESQLSQKTTTTQKSTAEIETLRSELKAVTDTLKQQKQEAEMAQYESHLMGHAQKMNLVEGGADVFKILAQGSRIDVDGEIQYRLPEGGIGSLDDLSSQWQKTAVGKSLMRSEQRGGVGSSPPSSVPVGKFDTAESRAEYLQKHGHEAFLNELRRQKNLN